MKKMMNRLYYPVAQVSGSNKRERNYYLDNLKFVLILLVVFGHFSMELFYVDEIKYLTYFIYIFHMPCFVFVSGYLAKRMNEGGKLRVDKILPIYWMYLIFKTGNYLIDHAFGDEVKLNLFKDLSAPWYLFALGSWYLLVPFLERFKTKYLIAGTFLLGLFAGYIENINSIMSMSRVIVFLPFFALGFSVSGKLNAFLDKKIRLLALFLLIAVLAGIAIFWETIKPFAGIVYGGSPYENSLEELADYGLPVRGIWYLLAVVVSGAFMLLIPRCKMFFSVLGERTLQIYILHIWIRNIFLNAGFFDFIQEGPRYFTVLVLLGSIMLTFLLSGRWLKKLLDRTMSLKIFAEFLI